MCKKISKAGKHHVGAMSWLQFDQPNFLYNAGPSGYLLKGCQSICPFPVVSAIACRSVNLSLETRTTKLITVIITLITV